MWNLKEAGEVIMLDFDKEYGGIEQSSP